MRKEYKFDNVKLEIQVFFGAKQNFSQLSTLNSKLFCTFAPDLNKHISYL